MSDGELHHELGPSGAHRWMVCTKSVSMTAGMPDTSSIYADEGTLAHEIAADVLRHTLSRPQAEWRNFSVKGHVAIGDLCVNNPSNADALQQYVDYVLERARECGPNPLVMVENRLDLGGWIPGGFGTGDCVIYDPKRKAIIVIDLKFGEGVMVYANERDGDELVINPQLGLYGLGAYDLTSFLDVEEVEVVIHQPRREHVSACVVTVADLLAFGERVRAAIAEIETNPTFRPGEKTCQWCKVKATCRARAEHALELFGREINMMTPAEIGEALSRADAIKAWVSDIEAHALQQLRAKSGSIPGWKVVEGRSTRKWNHLAPNILEQQLGDKAWDKKLIGIGAAEKLLGEKAKTLMPSITEKPPGAPVLAPDSDSRPSLSDALDGFTSEAAPAASYLD